jgi:DNA polymerase
LVDRRALILTYREAERFDSSAGHMKTKLHIDVETFSSTDIKAAGVYMYTAAPDFEILIVCYSVNEGPFETIDLARGDAFHGSFVALLLDPTVEKYAHNATFERLAFRAVGYDVPAEQWTCTAVMSGYCGLPMALADVTRVLKLGDRAKDMAGRALIRFFSCPVKATKANGGRVRNYPEHDLIKWQQYLNYCAQDVVAEMAVAEHLGRYTITQREKEGYVLDQKINDRGVGIDATLAEAAIAVDEERAEALREESKKLTGLDNPNSPTQLAAWLSSQTHQNIISVAKAEIEAIAQTSASAAVRRVISNRLQLSKTSIRKYAAMLASRGAGGRARGLFQFYGGSRTGRWAGRLIQLQNLPRNSIEWLDIARAVVRSGDSDALSMLTDNTPAILSQLVRTALIPSEGKTFAVADYSAIEARVIAWLASETWRLDVFNTHGKIYEASAAMMFGVPIEEVTKGSDYRSKGKVAELALGYQGGRGALIAMGGDRMGLTDDEMDVIVSKWRAASPRICNLWRELERCAIEAVNTPGRRITADARGLVFVCDDENLRIVLPSGRSLFYRNPTLAPNRFGRNGLTYEGKDQTTQQWARLETYGGKLVENVTQAVARDLLLEGLLRLDAAGFDVVMHVHDEVVAEVDEDNADESLEHMVNVLGLSVSWSPDLNTPADGYTTKNYRKD